jgi:hypothetical protein
MGHGAQHAGYFSFLFEFVAFLNTGGFRAGLAVSGE